MGIMRARLRFSVLLAVAGLGLAPAMSLAQSVPDATSNTAASRVVGPAELRNFTLPGTATRPSDQPASTAPAKPASTTPLPTAPDNTAPAPAKQAPERRVP